jgi:hypothetical protein
MGGEDISFPNGASPPVGVTTSGWFRSNYARCALSMELHTGYSKAFSGGGVTSCWLSVRFYLLNGYYTAQRSIGLIKNSTTNRGIFFGCLSANKLSIFKYNGTTETTLVTEVGASAVGLNKIDMQIIDYGGSGTVNLYVNGVLVATYTGDISVDGVSDLDSVWLGPNGAEIAVSEIIVASTDTRAKSLRTHSITGAGDANAWHGTYADIDEVAINDVDFVYSDAAADDIQCALADSPAGTFAVDAIKVEARACIGAGSPIDVLKLGVKHGGSIDVDAGQTLDESWKTYERMTTTINANPITTAILDAAQLNLRSAA